MRRHCKRYCYDSTYYADEQDEMFRCVRQLADYKYSQVGNEQKEEHPRKGEECPH